MAVKVLSLDLPRGLALLCLKSWHSGLHLSDPSPPSSCLPANPLDLFCPSPWTANPDLPAVQGSNLRVIPYVLLGSGFQAASVSGESFQCHISKMWPFYSPLGLMQLFMLSSCVFNPATHWPYTGLALLLAEHSFFLPAGLVASLQPSIGPASAGDLTCSPDPS